MLVAYGQPCAVGHELAQHRVAKPAQDLHDAKDLHAARGAGRAAAEDDRAHQKDEGAVGEYAAELLGVDRLHTAGGSRRDRHEGGLRGKGLGARERAIAHERHRDGQHDENHPHRVGAQLGVAPHPFRTTAHAADEDGEVQAAEQHEDGSQRVEPQRVVVEQVGDMRDEGAGGQGVCGQREALDGRIEGGQTQACKRDGSGRPAHGERGQREADDVACKRAQVRAGRVAHAAFIEGAALVVVGKAQTEEQRHDYDGLGTHHGKARAPDDLRMRERVHVGGKACARRGDGGDGVEERV